MRVVWIYFYYALEDFKHYHLRRNLKPRGFFSQHNGRNVSLVSYQVMRQTMTPQGSLSSGLPSAFTSRSALKMVGRQSRHHGDTHHVHCSTRDWHRESWENNQQ